MGEAELNIRAWSLFFGRPTTIKENDLGCSSTRRIAMGPRLCDYAGLELKEQMEIYEAHTQFFALASKIVNDSDLQAGYSGASVYSTVTALDKELNAWYLNLPPSLQWRPENIERAHFSFFLLQ